ncbi:mannitol dehydrogenase family protein [Deinococcus humi]|uniref:Mannitol 2-dehydrogenase n=1 Tax=Deinococcus humi TaxID=662880 RepID=A0A7W8NGI6_9DEIO|nr:mannitol dehydrogenase family protein [Deinococcus humi]MBB5363017.1 mannitol 2-dehydrogenase [Deinococcus humi]GGO25126.1 mannitol 2-dehydrogenase [Deinococcus humi]
MTKLKLSALGQLGPDVAIPHYDPRTLTTGIVHFGVGGFHRSHQAMYLDRVLNAGGSTNWGICGVGVLPGDARMRDVLKDQDGLYTLVTKAPSGETETRVIGAIHEFLFAPDDPEKVIETLAAPATRIVSLTVTEGGYSLNNATGEFDPTGADIAHDLQPGAVPRSVFGLITEGLRRRRERGIPPFTVMSCDNIQGNGHVTQAVLSAFARLKDAQLGAWIAREVAFPNSMVDRITPMTTDGDREALLAQSGIEDAWPVIGESFTQWVLEDHFTLGRPPLETVGVQVVADVEPYELMKLRLLNAAHQAMGYLGLLAGYTYVHQVCRMPVFVDFLLGYMAREGAPTLKPVPGMDLDAYQHELIERFASPAIQDTLARLIFDGSERIPKFLLPVVREQLAREGEISHAALVVASWAAYLEAVQGGETVPPLQDQRAAQLLRAVRCEAAQPGAFLDLKELFGDLGENARFRAAYLAARESLRRHGAVGAIEVLEAARQAAPAQSLIGHQS